MKPNVFLIIVSLLISALAGYGFYAANSGEDFALLLSIGSGICLAVSLIGTLGIKSEERTLNVNFRVVSALFFLVFLASNLIFGFAGVRVAPYVIVNGVLLLIYLTIEYGLVKSVK